METPTNVVRLRHPEDTDDPLTEVLHSGARRLLAQAVETDSGAYGAATETYLSALAHGLAPATGSELVLHYGAGVSLVGVTPTADPAVTG